MALKEGETYRRRLQQSANRPFSRLRLRSQNCSGSLSSTFRIDSRVPSLGSAFIARRSRSSVSGGQLVRSHADNARTAMFRFRVTGLCRPARMRDHPLPGNRRRSWSTKSSALCARNSDPKPNSSDGPLAISLSGNRSSASLTTRSSRIGSSVCITKYHWSSPRCSRSK